MPRRARNLPPRPSSALTPIAAVAAQPAAGRKYGYYELDAALAIKVSIPRPVVQGLLDDADCYGGRQYAVVLDAIAAASRQPDGSAIGAHRSTGTTPVA
jgi:hypothetical protein